MDHCSFEAMMVANWLLLRKLKFQLTTKLLKILVGCTGLEPFCPLIGVLIHLSQSKLIFKNKIIYCPLSPEDKSYRSEEAQVAVFD